EATHGRDIAGQVRRSRPLSVVDEPGPDVVKVLVEHECPGYIVDPLDGVFAVGAYVVGDDEAAVGSSHERRCLEAQCRCHRRDAVGPESGICVMLFLKRLVRYPVAPIGERHQAELIC
ncbi:MAG: hypothetical protein M3262_00250, partial [Actinomycetota bacterium]|nr:hypothetical protein [Actinomycetota bacterium]